MIVHSFYPDVRVAREVGVAVDQGYEVDVIALRRQHEPPVERQGRVRIYRLPISHHHGAGLSAVAWEYVGFTTLASLHVARLDVRRCYNLVQVHNPPDFLIIAAAFPKLLGAGVILDIHDLASDMFAMRFDGWRGGRAADRVLRATEKWAARCADAVLTVHDPYRRELVSRGIPAHKITVVMNSLDERLLPPAADGVSGGRFRIVYHGTLTPHYGVELLVEAAARVADDIPDLELAIYGDGDSLPLIRARADELGLADRLELSGRFLPQAHILGELRAATVGVIPNLPTRLNRFALSTKLFEYVALGVPVVCADLPTLREHFSDDEVLFFDAGDPGALAAALCAVARDPGAAASRAVGARRRYDEYRWPLNAARYAAVLDGCDRVVHRNGHRPLSRSLAADYAFGRSKLHGCRSG
jgi:glycosyltransferase involved in cell wall biosynthesis